MRTFSRHPSKPLFSKHPALRLPLAAILAVALLADGCASRYSITTTNGYSITTNGKPKYDKDRGLWHYNDMAGRPHTISTGSVTQVAPESMSKDKDAPANYTPASK